ncbi:MAG: hypothetical protein SynsKO_07150 [Synoicihabitans sp.]
MPLPSESPFHCPSKSRKSPPIPSTLLGRWSQGNRLIEIRANDWLYAVEENSPYQLTDGGTVFRTGRNFATLYDRVYGDPADLPGVWDYRVSGPGDDEEVLSLHQNGLFSFQSPDSIYYGEYSYDAAVWSTIEARSLLTESGGILTSDAPYAPNYAGPWSVVNDVFTWEINGTPSVWTRVP